MVAEKGAKKKSGKEDKKEGKAEEVEKEFQEAFGEVKKEVEALVRFFTSLPLPSLPPPILTRRLCRLAGGCRPDVLDVFSPLLPLLARLR